MSLRAAIAIIAILCLLLGIFLMVAYGRSMLQMAMVFVIISTLASAVANAIRQLEARLTALEARLAKCEHIPASAP
jgi:hypothetical protein